MIDTVIGLSVCYKTLENLELTHLVNPKMAVFGFGLVQEFGLSSKLQNLNLSPDGHVINMIAFNIGIDLTGSGKKFGLSEMHIKDAPNVSFDRTMEFSMGEYNPTAEIIDLSVKGPIRQKTSPFQSEIIDIAIEDFGEIEYKFIMPMDATIIYSREVLNAKGDGVYFDFHGHPATADAEDFPENFEMAYNKGESTQKHGSFTAPSRVSRLS